MTTASVKLLARPETFLMVAFAQLASSESSPHIEACLTAYICEGYTYSCTISTVRLSAMPMKRGIGAHDVRAGLDGHLPMPVALSLGAVSPHQVGDENADVAQPARQYPQLHPHLRQHAGRSQRARRAGVGGLGDLRPAVCAASSTRIFREPRQRQCQKVLL